jgi:hypothetical protein
MLKFSAAALAIAITASSTAAIAQTTCPECGNMPPPTIVCRGGKSDAGIGNGSERFKSEAGDCDPGRSGLHNQAGRNADKRANK